MHTRSKPPHALAQAMLNHHAYRNFMAKHIAKRAAEQTLDPKSHCHRCLRFVSPKESGLADIVNQRLWCKSCARYVEVRELDGSEKWVLLLRAAIAAQRPS